ncbi:MAG TPA: DUF503 domain-containing protein [Clostridiales bacterium]|nr:DUF503 domain-containing protein [Clostridiales bacterium]
MLIATMKIKLHLPWVHSLKEKRMVVKSLTAKLGHKFNISVAEVEGQDLHQIAVLGIAGIAGDSGMADSVLDHVLNFAEENTEGEIIGIKREVISM